MKDMSREDLKTTLLIMMEECAEVTQAASKILRFGLDNSYEGVSNRAHLETEIGDLLFLFDLLKECSIIDPENVAKATEAKRDKLARWSNLQVKLGH